MDEPDRNSPPERRERDGDRRLPPQERKSASVRSAIRSELAGDSDDDAAADVDASTRPPAPVVELRHVSLAFERPILEDVSVVANEGETIVLVGESGTGKSTALKLILRLLVPDKGRV